MTIRQNLKELADRWADADAGERANFQLYLSQLCRALDVPEPEPRGAGYEFEFAVRVVERDGTETTKAADLFKQGCFLLEAKDIEEGRSDEALLRKAYGQARGYVSHVPGDPPPYLLVLDVARTLLIWDRWNGSYGGFAAGRRIDLRTLHKHPEAVDLVRGLWTEPARLDPRARANAVTREIAGHLGELAASLEARGHDQEQVARFLIRCVFTMFAEDVGLLDDDPFLQAVREYGVQGESDEFQTAVGELWAAMDKGERFGLRKLLRFNGHFFEKREVLPLTKEDFAVLLEAAEADWRDVEPAIFGTLFTRALDPEERHKLGAEFTPRAFVERLVRPTIEEPVRERWRAVETAVFQRRERGHVHVARTQLHQFHKWLRSLTVLDPACGSGNFLYVSLITLKRIEAEVLQTLEDLTGEPDLVVEEVGPWQFCGIEIKPWAREITELTLWIGYHRFWQEHHGHIRPPEPVLRDMKTLECRDAVLAWDKVVEDPDRKTYAGTPRVGAGASESPAEKSPRPYFEYVNARPAEWPKADFIVGNPPYMGRGRQREEFGDGYVDALHAAYPEVNDNVDYVMYWWYRAAKRVAKGETIRAGLITTNSITQIHNREIVAQADRNGAHVVWASPDHPWVDDADAAAVRVAMTVVARDGHHATLIDVDDNGNVERQSNVDAVHADLTAEVDVARAAGEPLLANAGLSSQGFTLVGQGFVLKGDEARSLLSKGIKGAPRIRPYMSGRDLTRRPRDQYVIDFGVLEEKEARKYPVLFDIVRSRVKPLREENSDRSTRENWWLFGRNRPELREALEGLSRYVATSETSKHRFFLFLPEEVACSHAAVVLPLDDAFYLGVLSSRPHIVWSLAAGGRLEDRPRYQKTMCFDAFPFPVVDEDGKERVRVLAEEISDLRNAALQRDEDLTMTDVYNVVEKVRAGEILTQSEKEVFEKGACGVLSDVHEELDAEVAKTYGWPWPLTEVEILERLVKLHDERRTEEEAGRVHWLRPTFQRPRFAPEAPELELEGEELGAEKPKLSEWPDDAIGQIAAIKRTLAREPGSPKDVSARFEDASEGVVERHLETLAMLGEARRSEDGRYYQVEEPVAV